MATPAIGCRVRILKDLATVRYIGPVAKQEGIWVGVEWDDPSRGKHDGSTAGVRYFECKSGSNAGSFVRIERVCFGVSVLQALRARYNNEVAERGEEVAADELYVHTWRKRRVQVQLVGEEKVQQKQRQIHTLESARLVGLNVSAVGDPSSLLSALPRLVLLDLSSNLVADWSFVEELAGQALPHLQALNLSDNRIHVPPYNRQPPRPPLTGLRALVINDCGLAWADVLAVAPQLPSLEELHLCGNPIHSLQPPPDLLMGQPPSQPQPLTPTAVAAGGGGESGGAGGKQAAAAAAGGAEEEVPGERVDGPGPSTSAPAGVETGDDGGAGGGGSDDGGEVAAGLLASLFPRLQVLTLEEAQLVGWPTVELLRCLPALTRLHLGSNPAITTVRYPRPPHAPAPHPSQPPSPATPPAAAAAAATAVAPATASDSASSATARPAAAGSASELPVATTATAAATTEGLPPSAGLEPGPSAATTVATAATAAAAGLAFPRLTSLYMGSCGLADWGSVDQLDCFPALKELRLTGNPVLALSKTGGRFEVIGRVSGLQQLNGAEVRPRERRDSELRYLQHIAVEMEAAGADESRRAVVRAAHPQLRRLMELHGAVLATAARGGPGSGSLASSMVELKLTCVAAAAHAKMGTQVKKLPKSTTVSALRMLCERLFKVKADKMALFLRAPGEPLPEDIGGKDLDDRQLGFFGVQDGYEVLVDEADPEELRRQDEDARAAAAAAHEQRLAEQLRAAERMQAEFARSMGLQGPSQQQ